MDIWEMIASQRRQLVSFLDELDETQWRTPSLCAGWAIRDVVGHLIMPFELTKAQIMLRFARNRFDFNQTMFKTGLEMAQHSNRGLVDTLRANIESQWKPPILGAKAPLIDTTMHAQDISRPLDLKLPIDRDVARRVLDFLTGPNVRVVTKPAWIANLRFISTDLDWSAGTGPEIKGAADAIIMALGGRTAVLDELSGDGVAVLRERIAQK